MIDIRGKLPVALLYSVNDEMYIMMGPSGAYLAARKDVGYHRCPRCNWFEKQPTIQYTDGVNIHTVTLNLMDCKVLEHVVDSACKAPLIRLGKIGYDRASGTELDVTAEVVDDQVYLKAGNVSIKLTKAQLRSLR